MNRIYAVAVSEKDVDSRFGVPAPLFAMSVGVNLVAGSNAMAVTRDGSRIIIPQALPQPGDSNVIHIKSGWFETQH